MSFSRANSLPGIEQNAVCVSNTNERGRSARKDKGKGKETDGLIVKEEPIQISLSPDPSFGMVCFFVLAVSRWRVSSSFI